MTDDRKKEVAQEMLDNTDLLMRNVEDFTFELWEDAGDDIMEMNFPSDSNGFPEEVKGPIVALWQNSWEGLSQFVYRDREDKLKLTGVL